MSLTDRLQYYRRVFRAYLIPGKSQLTFWHEQPEANPRARFDELGEYYLGYSEKANYSGFYDHSGIPLLHYHGQIGLQYNPIAISQWGLGNYNLYCQTADKKRLSNWIKAADWLCAHVEQNASGLWVWKHRFDWEYRVKLKAPWYSALAQGQGISLLLRAYRTSGNSSYLHAAERAFQAFLHPIDNGGVAHRDERANIWFEEYLVDPPTHILNGFISSIWGVYDYFLATRDKVAHVLFTEAIHTLRVNLQRYDLGFWSLYELSQTRLPMVASPFYHRLHTAQLRLTNRMSGEAMFTDFAEHWEGYARKRVNRTRALCQKGAFKLCYY